MLNDMFKKWLLGRLFDLSSWIGSFLFLFEFFRFNSSNLIMLLALVLIFVPDSELKAFMTKHATKIQSKLR
jgi:hypothetical protein